jgi:hypothetical protein
MILIDTGVFDKSRLMNFSKGGTLRHVLTAKGKLPHKLKLVLSVKYSIKNSLPIHSSRQIGTAQTHRSYFSSFIGCEEFKIIEGKFH